MTTQAELLKSLRQKKETVGEPLPEFIAFGGAKGQPMGTVIQGVVTEVFVTSVWDGKKKARKLDAQGNEIPQLTITLQMADGTKRRQGFAQDLLWKLSAALEEHGLEEVPIGWEIASQWAGMVELKSGYEAKDHIVQVRNPAAK